ncbi:MAG: hypothetical protein ACRC9X_07070, partial [Bacteroidales bacterium]
KSAPKRTLRRKITHIFTSALFVLLFTANAEGRRFCVYTPCLPTQAYPFIAISLSLYTYNIPLLLPQTANIYGGYLSKIESSA